MRRGRICYAIYPFTAQFPFELADGQTIPNVEQFARAFRGQPVPGKVEVRLRPVLLLHDGTRGEHEDVACLRINTAKSHHRSHEAAWARITNHEHPFFFHLPVTDSYGLRHESLVAIASVGTVHKSAILAAVGQLKTHEMQIVSERLTRALGLDFAPLIARKARELMRLAGLDKPPEHPAADADD
ncbi:MAG TPA: type II toxin-antitoxin system PemK/MazF family toxin [Solirubrobacteraceae bacterium]|nr:type II toxin-antitoxin system PemK/MazF family toxin [Solirubrobacteraceae bacterium]